MTFIFPAFQPFLSYHPPPPLPILLGVFHPNMIPQIIWPLSGQLKNTVQSFGTTVYLNAVYHQRFSKGWSLMLLLFTTVKCIHLFHYSIYYIMYQHASSAAKGLVVWWSLMILLHFNAFQCISVQAQQYAILHCVVLHQNLYSGAKRLM